MIRQLLRKLQGKKVIPAKYPITKIYTDQHGNNWYMFDSVGEMPPDRMWRAALYTRHADLCLSRERLAVLAKSAYQSLNSKSLAPADAAVALQEILIALDHYAEENTLADLASVYIIGEDEDLYNYSEAYRKKKIAKWKADPQALSFFLSIVWKRTTAFSKHSDINILEYLDQQRHLTSQRKGRYQELEASI
jgi:hypothetical protein